MTNIKLMRNIEVMANTKLMTHINSSEYANLGIHIPLLRDSCLSFNSAIFKIFLIEQLESFRHPHTAQQLKPQLPKAAFDLCPLSDEASRGSALDTKARPCHKGQNRTSLCKSCSSFSQSFHQGQQLLDINHRGRLLTDLLCPMEHRSNSDMCRVRHVNSKPILYHKS